MNTNKNKNRGILNKVLLPAMYVTGIFLLLTIGVSAAPPPGVTTSPYTVSYSAKLADSSGNPVTTTQQIRFSLWSDADVDPTDYLGSGAIDPLATGFSGWQETHNVTPDSNGLFHLQLGSINTLPNFTVPNHIYLQVDVKPNGAPDTSYETLDPDGNTANLTDRHPVNSTAFAINSDTVDNRDVGLNAGEIPYLDGSAQLPVSTVPGGTEEDNFILDFDDSVSAPDSITLQFGNTLAKVLEYDLAANYFNFNDDVNITGDLTVTGNADFSTSAEFHMREVADESVADCTTIDELVLDTTENRIYSCSAPGSPGTWVAVSGGGGGSYNQTKVFEAEYNDSVYSQDGTNNRGKLEIKFADTDGIPGNNNYTYYDWTTRNASTQDIDLIIRTTLPEGFTGWQAVPVTFTYRTLTGLTADNQLDLTIEDSNGNPVALTGATGLANSSWTTANISFVGAPVWTAGTPITIKIKMSATSAGAAYAGNLTLNYAGL